VQKHAWLYDALESSLKHAPVSSSATQPPEAAIPSNVLQTSMAESWSSLQTLLGEEHKLGGRAFGDSGGKLLQEDVLRAQAIPSEPLHGNAMPASAYPTATTYSDARMTRRVPQSKNMARYFMNIVPKTLWNRRV
jgi:hypothetical protein